MKLLQHRVDDYHMAACDLDRDCAVALVVGKQAVERLNLHPRRFVCSGSGRDSVITNKVLAELQIRMLTLPFVLRAMVADQPPGQMCFVPTADEVNSPRAVRLDIWGIQLSGVTRLTKVQEETTDDE